jgi:hypothetical protein
MNVNRLLHGNQYGFREHHSTEYAAIHLVDKLNESLRNKKIPFAVFIDLSKAFDTLDHEILIKKLEHYGIEGTAIRWFTNYLGDRQQYVKYNNVTSPFAKIKTGVPQGSVLGPLLFLIYINDIYEATKALDDVLFADDTSLYGEITNFFAQPGGRRLPPKTSAHMEILSGKINESLARIVEWLKINKLSLNADKTKYMIFHNTQKMEIYKQLKLEMDGIIIERTETFNFLGLVLNETLTWSDHIHKIGGKIGSAIGILYKVKHCLPKKALITIYNSLILSHLNYCNLLWGHEGNKFDDLQAKALRAVTGYPIAHNEQLCKKLHTLTVEGIHKQRILSFYKNLNDGTMPNYIRVRFEQVKRFRNHTPVQDISTLNRNLIKRIQNVLKTADLDETIALMEPPNMIRINTAKRKIKDALIRKYKDCCTIPDCATCKCLADDQRLPISSRWRKRKYKTKVKKTPATRIITPCPINCLCSVKCKKKAIKTKFQMQLA